MLETRQHADFADESQLGGVRVGTRVQYFDRNLTLVSRIFCQVDGGKRTLPDLASYFVATDECGSERGNRIARRK